MIYKYALKKASELILFNYLVGVNVTSCILSDRIRYDTYLDDIL